MRTTLILSSLLLLAAACKERERQPLPTPQQTTGTEQQKSAPSPDTANTEPNPSANTEPSTTPAPQPNPQASTEPSTPPSAEPNPQATTEPNTAPSTEPNPQAKTEPNTEPNTQANAEPPPGYTPPSSEPNTQANREPSTPPPPPGGKYTPQTDPWNSPAIVPPPSETTKTAMLDCAKIVPQEIRSQYLPDATVTDANTSAQANVTASCQIQGLQGASTSGSVQASCSEPTTGTAASSVADFKKENPQASSVDVGEEAAMVEKGDQQELKAWDPKSGCNIEVTVPKNVDAVAFGRAIVDRLPPRG